jgi:hypothetical protein
MAHHHDDGDGNDPMAIGSSEDEEQQQGAAAPAPVPAPAPAAARRRAPAAKKAAAAAASSDEEDDEAKTKKKPTPAKRPAARKPPAATAARRAEAERAMKEEEERRERERVAAGPRFELLASQHATPLIPLLVANGGGSLSAVDLCELAVASKAFGDAVRAFWQSVQPPSAAGSSAAPTTATTAPNAATLLSSLSLEFSAWDAGRDRNERKNPGGTCAACGQFPAVASGYVAPGSGSKPVCKGCFGGMGTAFDESRGGTPRVLLAHCAAVLAPTAAHLFGTTPEEVAAAVPRYRPRLASMKNERGMRVSLRQAANWALRNPQNPGPLGVRRARANVALSEAAELSADVPRGAAHYESLDCRALDFRRHALRRALALALRGRVHSPAAAGAEEPQGGGGGKAAGRGKKAAAPLGDRPFDFEKHGGAALRAAANSHIGAGTPGVAAIVAMAVKMAELVQPGAAGAAGGGVAAAAAAAEEEEEAAAAPAPAAAGKKKAAPPPKRKAPAKKKKKAADDEEGSSEDDEAMPAPPAAKKAKQQQPKKKKKAADEEDEDESGIGEDDKGDDGDDDEAPATTAAKKKPQQPKKKPAAAAATKPARGRGGRGK